MDEIPYQTPNETSDPTGTEPRPSTTRVVVVVGIAVLTAFAPLAVWTWTARFPWSSGW